MRGYTLKETKKYIADNFKRHRKDFLDLTQNQTGEILGLGRTSITNIEKGNQPITACNYEWFMSLAPADDVVRKIKNDNI